jgi:endonuclease/exonuclease/phosphatase family metal-dependent hydrolase
MLKEALPHEWTAEEIRSLIRTELVPHFAELAECRSTAELHRHPRYRALEPVIRRVMDSPEIGHFGPEAPPPRTAYRFLAWNIERGIQLDGQIEAFRTHDYLKRCDVLLLTETDVGMARSGNRDVPQTLARALGFHYAFAPCYLNLGKGSGLEREVEGDNELGLHGNALLSRYPIRNVRAIPLENGIDKMSSREQRIGCQVAVAADIHFPNLTLTAVSIHLDANSSQRHRRHQMETILDRLPPSGPAILGGDWNTSTYNSSTAFRAIMGYWLRVLMGPDNVIRNHYLHPYRRFERALFELLERRGFDYRNANRLGEYTVYYDFDNYRTYKGLSEWVPEWCFPFIRWALRNHDGRCPLKLDWFATRDLRVSNPVVIHDLREGREVPLSDHDAIGLDVVAA